MTSISQLVLTVPPELRGLVSPKVPFDATYDAMARLFSGARKSLKILVPYLDPSFAALLSLTPASVKVVTTAAVGRRLRPNPILERCAVLRKHLKARYLSPRRCSALAYQVHSRLMIADGERAYIGSATLTDTSLHYSLETGVVIEDQRAVSEMERFVDLMFSLAVPAAKL